MTILLDFAEPMLIDPQFTLPETDDDSGLDCPVAKCRSGK
jgi:hypothetical protein